MNRALVIFGNEEEESIKYFHFVSEKTIELPEVGSSQSNRAGSVNASDANDKRFRSPPDRPFIRPVTPIVVFWHFTNDKSAKTSSTFLILSLYDIRRSNRSIALRRN